MIDMNSKIPISNSFKEASPRTDDEKIKARTAQSKIGTVPKCLQTPKKRCDGNKGPSNQDNKQASASSQNDKKVNSRAAHSGMVLKINPKKVTVVEPFNFRRIPGNEAEIIGNSKIPSPSCRSLSFKEKSVKAPCDVNTKANRARRTIKLDKDNVSVKKVTKPRPTEGQVTDVKNKNMNRSKTEPTIKIAKTAVKKEETKSVVKKPEQNPRTLSDFVSQATSTDSAAGRISPSSKKNAIGHSGIKFIPKAQKKSYFNMKIK